MFQPLLSMLVVTAVAWRYSNTTTEAYSALSPQVQTPTLPLHQLIRRTSILRQFTRPIRPPLQTSLYLVLALLDTSWDIELNPGPESQYFCPLCTNEVTWECQGIRCDSCKCWYHKDCVEMGSTTYNGLNSNIVWLCPNVECDKPNFSWNPFSQPVVTSDSNRYSILTDEISLPSSPEVRSMHTPTLSHHSTHSRRRHPTDFSSVSTPSTMGAPEATSTPRSTDDPTPLLNLRKKDSTTTSSTGN